MFFRIWAFILCGCFLFETPLGRHLQTGQSFSELLGFGHVEERPESVKSFSSKQSESSASDPGEDYDGGSFAGTNENEQDNYLEYADTESDQNEVGSGVVENSRDVEQADDNNIVNNVHDGSPGKYANEDGRHGGGTSYDKKEERLLGGNIEDTSIEDSRSDVSLGNEKDLDNPAQQGEDSTNKRLKYDSSVKSWVNQSVDGNVENLHSELSSHVNGPANDPYVTHVVESADDKEKTEDGENGGSLPSRRINDSEVTHNIVEQSRSDVKADESVSRMSENPNTDVVSHDEDATVGDDYNKEDKSFDQGLVTRKMGHVGVEGDANVKSNNDENPSPSTAANFVETSRDADQEVTNKHDLNPGVHAEKFAEESDPNAVDPKTNEVVHFTNVIEPDASDKGPAERDERLSKFNNHLEKNEEENASRAKDMTTNVVTDSAEPKVGDEDRAEQDEESHAEPKDHPMLKSDWNGKDKSTENVAPSDVSETGDERQASEEEESNSNSAQISNATVAQILKSSRVTKDMANENEKIPASDESSQAVPEEEKDEQGTEYSSDNTAPHRAESDPEEGQENDGQKETASEGEEPLQGDAKKLALKSKNKAVEKKTDPSEGKTEADGDNESNDAHSHARAHDEESTEDDEDIESQTAQPLTNEDQEGHEEEGSSSDGEKGQYRVPDDKIKSVHDEVSERKAKDPNNDHRTKAASPVTDGKSQKKDREDKQEAFDDHTAASGAEPSGEGVKHENNPPSDEAQLKNHGGKMSEKLRQAGQRVVESMDNVKDDDHDFHKDHVDNAHDDDNVQSVRDEDSAAEDEKQEENRKMNEEDQENTAKDKDSMTKDAGQQDETDSINSFLVKHGKMSIDNMDQAKQKKHTVESSASESRVKNRGVSIKEKTVKDGDWPDEQDDDNSSSEEYDDVDLLSSGTSEPSLFDGDQLESASLISSKPSKEGRVARAKIYRPKNHGSFLKDEGSQGSDSNPRHFTNYVADDGKEEQLQLEDDKQENAMGRDWLGERPVKVKDWGEGGLSGATRNSGLKNDYEKADGDKRKTGKMRNDKKHTKAAHEDLRHSKRTRKIFASLEKRLGNNKISHTKESSGLKFYAKLKGSKKKKGKKYTAAVHRTPNHFKKTQEILTSLENEIFNDGNKEGTSKSRGAKTHSHKRIHVKLHHKDHSREHKSYIDYSGLSPPGMISPQMFPVVAATPYTTPMALPKPQFTYHDLRDAQLKGAVCLDGSTPKFFFRKGFGDGLHNWIIYLQGGAWCETRESCLERSTTQLGSSRYVKDVDNPGGLLSADYKDNPAFFNWNVVYLPYCDGSSFAGNRSEPVRVEGDFLYFRGKRILSAAMDDLLIGGLQHAREVVLSGTSAGGLAVMLHADYIRGRLPNHVHLHSLADSGFFLDMPNRKGKAAFRKAMQNVFKLHDCTSGVNQRCVAKMSGKDLWKCIFPQYFLKFVQSPLYVVNPIFDSWQLENIYEVHCAYHVEKCTDEEKKEISKFGHATMTALHSAVHHSPAVQMFADACVDHGQVISNLKWRKIKVKNLSISSAFTKWYRQTNQGSVVDDTQFLVNPTCV